MMGDWIVSEILVEDLVRQMLQRYGGKDAKVLSRKQFRLDEKAFKPLDRDENGELDATELARVVEREPDLDMKVRVGKKGDKETVVEILGDGKRAQALGAKVSAEKDGTVVLEIGVSRVEVRLARTDRCGRLPHPRGPGGGPVQERRHRQ